MIPVSPPPASGGVVSPLIRAALDGDRRDMDSWLAGMNGVALFFLAAALIPALPGAVGMRPAAETAVLPEWVTMELAGPGEPPPAALNPAEATPAEALPELTDRRPPEPSLWRQLPKLIESVLVAEPEPSPETPAAQGRKVPPHATPSSMPRDPRPRPGASPAPQAVAAAGSRTSGTRIPGVPAAAARTGEQGGSMPLPPYPAFARRNRLQGTVVVSIAVKNGVAVSVQVVSSSGAAALDRYAVSHVQRRWKWPEATTRTFTQPFRFVLE